MRLVSPPGSLVWVEKIITIEVSHKINLKLWQKMLPPQGWKKRCVYNRRYAARVTFRALQFDAPNPSAEWYEEVICKLHMIQETR